MYTASRPKKPLAAHHRRQLEEESGIAREIITERGVQSITRSRQLPKGFSQRQRRRAPGILFTVHRPNGETSYNFRPDEPDPERPGRKYEQPSKHYGGPGNILDVHPRMRHLIEDTSVEVTFVEGIKKADALTSGGVLAIAISGVWNWLSEGEPISDMHDVPVVGRRVNICFDSDMLSNPNVQDAAQRLAEHLISRGAEVWITYLPDKSDGSKMGADDFFVAGGTLPELKLLMRAYDPADFTKVRLSRNEQLRLALADLERRFWSFEWKGIGGYSARDVYLKLIEAAKRSGKLADDGVRVVISHGTLELEAKIGSRRTLYKAIGRLEEAGLVYRDNEDRKPDKAGAFVLRATVNHNGTETGQEEQVTPELQTVYARGLHLRAPRLRWSSPPARPRRGVVCGARKVRQGPKLETQPAIKRLGKRRGAIVDVLDDAGGSVTLQEMAGALNIKRPRELARRKTTPAGRNGPLLWLEEAGIIAVVGDVVNLVDNWLDRLEQVRELGREVEAEESARRRLAIKRRAFHTRHKTKPDKAPTPAQLEAQRPAFVAALEAQKRARGDRMHDMALEAFNSPIENGAQKNLDLILDGELTNIEALVKSVLAYHRHKVFDGWEAWRTPVLEAAVSIARGRGAAPVDDWLNHPLDCECVECTSPLPSFVRIGGAA